MVHLKYPIPPSAYLEAPRYSSPYKESGRFTPQKAHLKRSAFFPPTTGKNIYISKIYGLAECILVKEFESTEEF